MLMSCSLSVFRLQYPKAVSIIPCTQVKSVLILSFSQKDIVL